MLKWLVELYVVYFHFFLYFELAPRIGMNDGEKSLNVRMIP